MFKKKPFCIFENGNSLTIDAGNNSAQNVYIQSLQVDGNEYTKNYLRHGDLLKGGTLKFEMGDKPNLQQVSVRKIIRIRFLRKSVGSCMFFVPLHGKNYRKNMKTILWTVSLLLVICGCTPKTDRSRFA